ncbi:serine hydrolase domain-containing protein [Sutcliffiella halmapala]
MYKEYIKDLVETGEIPGGVLYVSKKDEVKCLEAYGSFTDRDGVKQHIHANTLFDVASLTKISATVPSILYLVAKGELKLDTKVEAVLPKFQNSDVTIEHLLIHTSGLSADLPYRERKIERDVLQEIYQKELTYVPGQKMIYSDLGMILLGKITENVTDQALDIFVKEKIHEPWGMMHTRFNLSVEAKKKAASTEKYQDSYIQGEVHDEKAYQLGGVSGSAGLFSTIEDMAIYARILLYPGSQSVIPPSHLKMAVEHRQFNRGLGFEVWSGLGDAPSCGDKWSIGSFGHTGFTGTSLWVDPTNQLIGVFLTNAVHYGRETPIRSIRKKLHTLIFETENIH